VTPPPERAKRVLDLVVAVAALPVALPVIALLGLAVRLETKGGIFFRQTRVGQHGRHFRIFKLRTMVENAEQIGAGIYAEADDPRFTRVGTFARRFSLDELPQLFNVLRGEMSIVGPRPMLPVTVEQYAADYAVILRVKPGLTGLAQVSGRNALARSERLTFDRRYAENCSIDMDVRILLRTVRVLLTGEGQLNNQGAKDVER
jgi:lipopolysaccharide/colanic/teichoic acid biosynthesis glycosyltransferase